MPPADGVVEDGMAALRGLVAREKREHTKQARQHTPDPKAAAESDSLKHTRRDDRGR
jgi:hypothetical protein